MSRRGGTRGNSSRGYYSNSNERRPYGTGRSRYNYEEDYDSRDHQKRSNSKPIILAKPERSENIQAGSNEATGSGKSIDSRSVLLSRKDSSNKEESRKVDSPKPLTPKPSAESYNPNEVSNFVPPRNVKLVDDQQFCEPLADCMTDNSDFIVVGVLGTQGVGKSFILNCLIKIGSHQTVNPDDTSNYNKDGQSKPQADRTFRVQTFEKQMLSEHCTNGINAWIGADRIICLDTQPLFSNSFLDRAVQLEKKFSFEFHGAENTIEVHSLQSIGYIMSICHVVLVVQEGSLCDIDLLEKIRIAADLLKPNVQACASFDDGSTTIEYAPEVIFVHNKLELSEMGPKTYENLRETYIEVLGESLHFRSKTGLSGDKMTSSKSGKDINLFLIPDVESEENMHYSDENLQLGNVLLKLRQTFSSLQMRPFTTNLKQTEKSWFQHAQKSWENIKSSNFYMEYSRLLRTH